MAKMSTVNVEEVYSNTLTLLSHDKDGSLKKLLESIIEWEREHPQRGEFDGFEWHMVFGDPRTLNGLVTKRILKVVFKSNKCCMYRVTDLKAVEKALADYEGSFTQEEVEIEKIDFDKLFQSIVGHEDKKEILKRALTSEKPVHCLLYGTVASAKTLFLEELSKLPHNRFILGSSLTKAGIFDVLFNERPRYLILDEIDKIDDTENLSALLSLMHKGYVTETKYRRHRTIRLKTWVFASANDITRLPPELLSRFTLLRFRDYTPDEFREVVVNVLKEQEGVPEQIGIYIAEQVMNTLNSRDVRKAISAARLLKENTKSEVDRVIELLRKQT